MKIYESYQDVESYLRGSELFEEVTNKFNLEEDSSEEISNYIKSKIEEVVGTERLLVVPVVVCKVVGDDVDLIDHEHYVLNYNGYYYDWTAIQYNDSFEDKISKSYLPVIQPVVRSDRQINSRLSTVKGYVLLGY